MNFESLIPIITVLGSIGALAIWLADRLNKIKDLIFAQIEKTNTKIDSIEKNLSEKLEYHERHDDKRFTDISNSLWELRLRNAAESAAVSKKDLNNKRTNINDD